MNSIQYDLHIHSCLSPCGEDEMTPANLVGMAAVCGLQVIAVTDHNSSRNCPAAMEFGKEYGVIVIPGMELCTAEEVHVVCLFAELNAAMEFDSYVYGHMIKIPNRPEYFGHQYQYSKEDQIIAEEPNLLITASTLEFGAVEEIVPQYQGVVIPAHMDKNSNSLLSNLGFVPPNARFGCFELASIKNLHRLRSKNPYLSQCEVICDSDAHKLEDIGNKESQILVSEISVSGVLDALR